MKLVTAVREKIRKYKEYFKSKVTSSTPYKPLVHNINRSYGRNASGSITVRHRKRGHKYMYRDVSFDRQRRDLEGEVVTIERDPNRNAFIALVRYSDLKHEYILATEDMKVGMKVMSSDKLIENSTGSHTKFASLPAGTIIHNIEITPGSGGKIARAAGSWCTFVGVSDKGMAIVRMPSKRERYFDINCRASIGVVSNSQYMHKPRYKASQSERRSSVRGIAMNAVSHPRGGSGRCKGPIVSYTGKRTHGVKTAKRNRPYAKFQIK